MLRYTVSAVYGPFTPGNIDFFCDCWLYFDGIWNNYVDEIQQENMQGRFIMNLLFIQFKHAWFNSASPQKHLTRI